ALVALLRRTGTAPNTGVRYGPGSAAHHAVKNGALRCVRGTHGIRTSFPGRDAALFALLRRTGIAPNTGVRYGPGSAAHHAVKNGALRCVRGTQEEHPCPPFFSSRHPPSPG